jgi:hypothetical protein
MMGLLAFAFAGLIDGLEPSERHIETCRIAVEEAETAGNVTQAHGVWKACLGEAERLGYADLTEGLRAILAVTAAEVEAEPIRVSQPHRWSVAVLTEAAAWSTVTFPTDIVRRVFRQWMEVDEGRAFAEPIRSVSVNWKLPIRDEDEQVVRRYLEDAGLKWVAPGDATADVILFARLDRAETNGEGSAQGTLVRITRTLAVERARLPARSVTLKGFTVSASAESPGADEAAELALRVAADAAAQRLLLRLLGELFPPVD